MHLNSNNIRGSSPVLSYANVSQPWVVPVGSIGSVDHQRDLTILSRLSGGVTKWASSTDGLNWAPYVPTGFTVNAPPSFGGPTQNYTLNAPAYATDTSFAAVVPGTKSNGEYISAADPTGMKVVAIPRFTSPCAPLYSSNGGPTLISATGTSGFPTQSGGFDQYSVVFVNGRFLLYMYGSSRTYSSTDGDTWTLVSSSAFFGGNGSWVPSPTTSYAMSDHGSAFYRYEGIGTTSTEITGVAGTTSGVYNYSLMAPGGTSANGFLFHHGNKISYYTGSGTTVTATGTTTTRFPYMATWDTFNNRWLAIWADKYDSWSGTLNNITLEASTDNGATWVTLSSSVPAGLPQKLYATSSNSFILFTRNSAALTTTAFITDNTWAEWNQHSSGSIVSNNPPHFGTKLSNGSIWIGANDLIAIILATSVSLDYRSWWYSYYNPATSDLEVRVSKIGASNSWTDISTPIKTAINNNGSLPFRSYNFINFGDTAYMAASVDKPGHSNTGPLVLKSTNGGSTWSPSLDLRGSVTGFVITDPGQYSMAPTITLTAVSTTGTQAVFAPVLRAVHAAPVITFGGTGLTTQILGSPSGGFQGGASLPSEQYSVIKGGVLDKVVVTRKGMNVSTGSSSMSGSYPTGSTSATVTYNHDTYTGLTDITLTNVGTGYPPGRYELTITKNPSDPAPGGGKAFVEIGSPNTAWQSLTAKGNGQTFISLVPTGLIDYSKGSLSSSTMYVTTNGGTSWTRYTLPASRSTGLHPQPARINSIGTIIIRGGLYLHHSNASVSGLLVYGSQIRATGVAVQQIAAVWVGSETSGVPTFANPATITSGSTSFITGNHLYSSVVSVASPGNATTGSSEIVAVTHFVASSNPSLVQHAVGRSTTTGATPSFSPVSALSFANLGNTLINKIDYNQRESLWVLYLADGRVLTSPSATAAVSSWTTVTNPGNLF